MVLAWELAAGMVLCLSVATDLARRVIYNWITFPAMVLGLILGALSGGWAGANWSLLGLVVGGGLLLLPFLAGALGGGDVKLLAALGALGGPVFALKAMVYACLAGGVLALAIMTHTGNLGPGLLFLRDSLASLLLPGRKAARPEPLGLPGIPFAVCLLAGSLASRFLDFLAPLLRLP